MNTGIEIYKFVDKVQQHFNADEDIFETVKLFGDETKPIMTLENAFEFGITEFDDEDFSIKARYKEINGKMLGLNKEDYSNLVLFLTATRPRL